MINAVNYLINHTCIGPLSGVGNLTSSEVDHCTLHFTWTAPYTLQGVPIDYYTINITRHSDGAVLQSDTTNTTEYLYNVSSLGESLEVVVAAVNGAGKGNETGIIIQSPLCRTISATTSDYVSSTTSPTETIMEPPYTIIPSTSVLSESPSETTKPGYDYLFTEGVQIDASSVLSICAQFLPPKHKQQLP